MDTTSLIIMSMGVPLIAIGLPLLALIRYLSAPEDKKKRAARGLKIIAITWVVVGLMIYLLAIIGRFILKIY
jgi:heme/copper-type cytochrome/quinol oxidase subunit 2